MANDFTGTTVLSQFADQVRRTPVKAKQALVAALNTGGEFARQRGVDQIFSELNLKRTYIDQRLEITRKATAEDLSVVITGRARPTTLKSYGGDKIVTAAAKSPRRKLKGDKRRRIAKGQKAAGIKAFKIKRSGTAQKWAGGFIIYLKSGSANDGSNVAMAIRTGKGRDSYRVVYGPSVGSAWKSVRNAVYEEALGVVAEEFQKEFSRIV